MRGVVVSRKVGIISRRAAESLELRIFDAGEEGLGKQRADGLRRNGEWEKTAAGFRGIRPSRRDDPTYQNVPNGNSEISVLSVLKITMRGVVVSRGGFGGTQRRRGERCLSKAEHGDDFTTVLQNHHYCTPKSSLPHAKIISTARQKSSLPHAKIWLSRKMVGKDFFFRNIFLSFA